MTTRSLWSVIHWRTVAGSTVVMVVEGEFMEILSRLLLGASPSLPYTPRGIQDTGAGM